NITAGIELIGRREGRAGHGLVFPLIMTGSGAQLWESEGDNIWPAPARTSPYKFYQFWLNADDRDVEQYLKLFTFLELGEISGLMREHQADAAARPAQRRLAWAATALLHGEDEAEKARVASEALFGRGTGGDDGDQALHVIAESSDIPVASMPRTGFGEKMPLVDVLVRVGLASSKADARRGLQGGGYYINGEQVGDLGRHLTLDDFG